MSQATIIERGPRCSCREQRIRRGAAETHQPTCARRLWLERNEASAQVEQLAEQQEQADARFYAMRDDRDRLQALLDAHQGFLRDALNRLGGGTR